MNSSIKDAIERSEKIRTAHLEPLTFKLHSEGASHRDLIAALLMQAFDLLMAEGADHGQTLQVFTTMANAFGAVRLDLLHVPNVNNE